jgi:hypothetical protein
MQFNVDIQNARLDAIESTIGESPTIQVRTGAAPADCAAAATGTLLASVALPANWMNNAASGVKTKLGTWEDNSADASGTAGHFRLIKSSVCYAQGSISLAGGGGDMIFDEVLLEAGQQFRITTFTLTDGNG